MEIEARRVPKIIRITAWILMIELAIQELLLVYLGISEQSTETLWASLAFLVMTVTIDIAIYWYAFAKIRISENGIYFSAGKKFVGWDKVEGAVFYAGTLLLLDIRAMTKHEFYSFTKKGFVDFRYSNFLFRHHLGQIEATQAVRIAVMRYCPKTFFNLGK